LADARPEFLKRHLGGPTGERFIDQPETLQNQLREYYRLVSGMDHSIGRLREQLTAAGVADNTVILFTSDNGHFFGERGFAGKWLMHEPSLRVPFLYHDPRVRPSRRPARIDEPVLTIDVAPTLLDLAGVPAPASMQGKSLLPLLANPRRRHRDEFFYEHLYSHGGQIAASEGVRDRRFKYIRYINEDPAYEELYDLESDPDELDNLAGSPGSEGLLASMRARHAGYVESLA
jgi:arylsulfatase A-like enzyme